MMVLELNLIDWAKDLFLGGAVDQYTYGTIYVDRTKQMSNDVVLLT